MAVAPPFSGSVNINGDKFDFKSSIKFFDFSYINNPADPNCKTDWNKSINEFISHNPTTEFKYVNIYNTKIPISPILTEEDRERITEEAKQRCAASWLEV